MTFREQEVMKLRGQLGYAVLLPDDGRVERAELGKQLPFLATEVFDDLVQFCEAVLLDRGCCD